jgi:hypothetical protein
VIRKEKGLECWQVFVKCSSDETVPEPISNKKLYCGGGRPIARPGGNLRSAIFRMVNLKGVSKVPLIAVSPFHYVKRNTGT